MSTDLRTLLKDADPGSWEPLDLAALTREAQVRKRQRRIVQGLAGVAMALIALFAAPNMFKQLGIQRLETTDDPPVESDRNVGIGTGGSSKTEDVTPPRIGADEGSGAAEIGGQAGPEVGTTGQGSAGEGQSAATPAVPTPKPVGTYSYSVSGRACGGFAGCGDMEELKATFHQPSGSHQQANEKWINKDGDRYEAEYGSDYRPDGVYLEHFTGVYYNSAGAVMSAWACPELKALPVRVWPAGAKPGDHFEYTVQCEGGSDHTSVDIVRAEKISVGGRDVDTLMFHAEVRRGDGRIRRITDGWVFPSHLLLVKEDAQWFEDFGGGQSRIMLESMTPS